LGLRILPKVWIFGQTYAQCGPFFAWSIVVNAKMWEKGCERGGVLSIKKRWKVHVFRHEKAVILQQIIKWLRQNRSLQKMENKV